MVIQQVFFNHKGGRYVYKIHKEKIKRLCSENFKSLQTYLNFVLENCPDSYFNGGPRSSCLKFKLLDNIFEVGGHEVSTLAKHGLEVNNERFRDAHSKVQTFMLENDKTTLAMEVPIWLKPDELAGYQTLFKSKDILTGHIDILRIEGKNVWIWDYKPNANKEKYASTQIFFYAFMLSKRTGIPMKKFRCGYFDKNFTFVFKPESEVLYKLNQQATLKAE